MYFNDTLVIQLSKEKSRPTPVDSATAFDTYSPQRMFRLTSVDVRDVQMDVMRLLVPTDINARKLRLNSYQKEKKSAFFRIASGNLNVEVSNKFSAEMERITKKRLPSRTSIQMIFNKFDEFEDYISNISPVFKDLLPHPEPGRIFIGFPTHQTTGCCSHISARVIPTVCIFYLKYL